MTPRSRARGNSPSTNTSASSFERGLLILRTIAEAGPTSALEVADVLDIPLSTVYRYLGTLTSMGMIRQDQTKYRLEPEFRSLVGPGWDRQALVRASHNVLEVLVRESGETANLLVRSGLRALSVDQVTPDDDQRVELPKGTPMPLHAGAEHRVLLAFAPDSLIRTITESVTPMTSTTLPAQEILSSLEWIREHRVTVSRGELMDGVTAVGAPVLVRGQLVCSVGVAGRSERCDQDWLNRAVPLVRAAARTLEATLSYL